MAANLVVERIQSDLVLVTFGIMLWLLVVVVLVVVMMVEVLMLRLLLLLLLTLLLLLQEGVMIKVEVLRLILPLLMVKGTCCGRPLLVSDLIELLAALPSAE